MKNDKPFVSQYEQGGCPDLENLDLYFERQLEGAEKQDISKHVDGCMACWTYLQAKAGEAARSHLSVVE